MRWIVLSDFRFDCRSVVHYECRCIGHQPRRRRTGRCRRQRHPPSSTAVPTKPFAVRYVQTSIKLSAAPVNTAASVSVASTAPSAASVSAAAASSTAVSATAAAAASTEKESDENTTLSAED